MRWFSFLVVCEWFDLHSLVSCFYCFGTQIASVCTCLCKMCRNISELLAQRVQLVDGAGSLFMQRPLFTVCVMSGAVSRLQTRHGKDSEAPSNAAFVWMGGRFSVWRLDPDQTNPPVTHQVPGSSVIPAEADSAKKKRTLWFLCGVVLLFQVWKKQVFILGGEYFGWLTEQRVNSLEWGRLIPYLKKSWKSSVVVGINPSASLLKDTQRREGCWLRYVAFQSVSLKPWSCFPRRIVTPGLPSLDSCQAHRVSRQATWLLLLSAGGELGL